MNQNLALRKLKVVIIHGNGGCTNQHHWTPWLKAELEKNKIIVVAPTMPDNVEAKASIWLPYMHDVLRCDENTIVVGHSSGAVAAMRYAEQYKLLGSVLIAACHTDLGYTNERVSGYYDAPWHWDIIKKKISNGLSSLLPVRTLTFPLKMQNIFGNSLLLIIMNSLIKVILQIKPFLI